MCYVLEDVGKVGLQQRGPAGRGEELGWEALGQQVGGQKVISWLSD